MPSLFDCVSDPDELVRMRAADALEKISLTHPDWFSPYTDELLTSVSKIQQPSVQWHLALIFNKIALNLDQKHRATAFLLDLIRTPTDWIVTINSITTLATFAKSDPALKQELHPLLIELTKDARKSVAKRASRLLVELAL
jgi:HEAT repeat protein